MNDDHLIRAVKSRRVKAVRRLLMEGADPNAEEERVTPLNAAVLLDDETMVTFLIQAGARVSPAEGATAPAPLVVATRAGPAVVRLLLDSGADPCRYDEVARTYPLIELAGAPDSAAFAVVAEAAKDLNITAHGVSALLEAATEGREDNVRTLLKLGADVLNPQQEQPPSTAAASWAHESLASLLRDVERLRAQEQARDNS